MLFSEHQKMTRKRTKQEGTHHYWSKDIVCKWTNDPSTDISAGVFRMAIDEAKKGDADAIDWLVSEDGACLWLRAMGFSIRPSMRQRLRELALDKSDKVWDNQ